MKHTEELTEDLNHNIENQGSANWGEEFADPGNRFIL